MFCVFDNNNHTKPKQHYKPTLHFKDNYYLMMLDGIRTILGSKTGVCKFLDDHVDVLQENVKQKEMFMNPCASFLISISCQQLREELERMT